MYQENINDIKDKLDEYIEIFGEYIPLIMVKDKITEAQLKDRIEKAIEEEVEIPMTSSIYYRELPNEVI